MLAGLLLFQSLTANADVNSEFPEAQQDFAAYIEATRKYVLQFSMSQRTQAERLYNLPFEFSADPSVTYRGRFLLIHGLNDSPYVWHDMGQSLAAMGFDVRAILLPGHGTTPRAQLNVRFREWLRTVRQQIAVWNSSQSTQDRQAYQTTAPLYLGGFSLGGVLATTLALEDDSIAGLLLVSPAWHSKLNHLLRWSGLYKYYKPWVFGGMIIEDNPAKYNSIPINSAAQYYNATRYLKKRWKNRRLSIPVLVLATADDSVVDVDYMRALYHKRFNGNSRAFVLYSNDTSVMLRGTEVRRSGADLDRRIINQSHLSLINSPDNELFGEPRRVLVCNGNEPRIFFGCMRASGHWFGAQHTESPDGVAVARTTYNPDYDYVVEMVDRIFSGNAGR